MQPLRYSRIQTSLYCHHRVAVRYSRSKSFIQSYKRYQNAPRFDLLTEAWRGYPDNRAIDRFLREGA
ncbi:hypothetical protein N7490_006750 [Penicillium lividum]|nr:hypothetical protein N7490_006750 [Penicillium lividum]